MKFIMITLAQRSTVVRGPSGQNYVIYRGKPFCVENKDDADFFKKSQRYEATTKDKVPAEKPPSEELANELGLIEGLTKVAEKVILAGYRTIKDIISDIDLNGEACVELTKKQQEIVKEHFGGNK